MRPQCRDAESFSFHMYINLESDWHAWTANKPFKTSSLFASRSVFFAFSDPPSLPGLEGSEGEPASMNPRDSAPALSTDGNSLEKPQRSKLNSEPFWQWEQLLLEQVAFWAILEIQISRKNWMAFFCKSLAKQNLFRGWVFRHPTLPAGIHRESPN